MTSLNAYYNFKQTPFSRSIATQDLFPAGGHQEIQGRLAGFCSPGTSTRSYHRPYRHRQIDRAAGRCPFPGP